MRIANLAFTSIFLFSVCEPIFAQIPPAPISATATDRAILRTVTEVALRLSQELSTKNKQLRVGQRIHMETAAPIIVQGITVVPVGSPAMGEITDVTNKGMWGKSGHFGTRVLYMTVNGRQIRLSGAFDDKGIAGGIGAVAVSWYLFPPAGFFMTGTSAKIPMGAPVKGYVDEDVPLEMAAAPLAPLAVNAPAIEIATPQSGSPIAAPSAKPVLVKLSPTPPTAVPAVRQ